MASFLSRQSSYGRPAEAPFVDQPVGLEAQAAAAQQNAELSYLKGMNLPDVRYWQGDKNEYDQMQSEANQLIGDLHKEIADNGGILTPETKKRAQQVRSYIQNNPNAKLLEQRRDRLKTYIEDVQKNDKFNSERKDQLITFANKSATEDKSGEFYLPEPIESTDYINKAIKIAGEISPTDDPEKQYAWLQKNLPGIGQVMPEEQFALIQGSTSQERTVNRIKSVITAMYKLDPAIAKDIKADSDVESLNYLEQVDLISNPESQYYDPYQARSENPEAVRQQMFEKKIDDIANIAADAKYTQKVDQTVGLHKSAADEEIAKSKAFDDIVIFNEGRPVTMNYETFENEVIPLKVSYSKEKPKISLINPLLIFGIFFLTLLMCILGYYVLIVQEFQKKLKNRLYRLLRGQDLKHNRH